MNKSRRFCGGRSGVEVVAGSGDGISAVLESGAMGVGEGMEATGKAKRGWEEATMVSKAGQSRDMKASGEIGVMLLMLSQSSLGSVGIGRGDGDWLGGCGIEWGVETVCSSASRIDMDVGPDKRQLSHWHWHSQAVGV